jgi:hypothetical protein
MARQFSPKHVLRMCSNAHLEAYGQQLGIWSEVSFQGRKETDVDDIYEAWQLLPPRQRAQVDVDLSEINALATEVGATCLAREAARVGIDLGPAFEEHPGGFHDKAFFVFLHHRNLFDHVVPLVTADELPARYWEKRNDLPPVVVKTDLQTVESLASVIRSYFKDREGRGHTCIPETIERDGATYFFCYVEDYARVEMVVGEDGKLNRSLITGATFEVIFVVSRERNSFDTYFHGPKATTRDLQSLFTRAVFGFDLPTTRPKAAYELEAIKWRSFVWVIDPAGEIASVAVKTMTFTSVGGLKRRKTLEADLSRSRLDIYDYIEADFDTGQGHSDKPPLVAYRVTKVRLQVLFHPLPGKRRPPSKTFTISYPNGCSLGLEGRDGAIREMLRRSGVERRPAPTKQRVLVGNGSRLS